jgi:hypothetical protein
VNVEEPLVEIGVMQARCSFAEATLQRIDRMMAMEERIDPPRPDWKVIPDFLRFGRAA